MKRTPELDHLSGPKDRTSESINLFQTTNLLSKFDMSKSTSIETVIYGDEEINLIDLKPANEEVEENKSVEEEDEGSVNMDFSKLKLIENPVEEMSSDRLSQTLSDCVGCLDGLYVKCALFVCVPLFVPSLNYWSCPLQATSGT